MGGFLLQLHDQPVAGTDIHRQLRGSIHAMQANGLALKTTISRDRFTLLLFSKRFLDTENILHCDRDDFIACTGTMFFRRKSGTAAMQRLFNEFSLTPHIFRNLRGHYCAMLYKSGDLYLFNDLNGIYHVFSGNGATVLGSSFIAVVKATANRTVRPSELFENIFCGPIQGTRTVFEDIVLLDSRRIHQFKPVRKAIARPAISAPPGTAQREDDLVEECSDLLQDYMSMVKDAYGDSVTLALSGGFDSRLLQAAVRRAAMQPAVYVYGPDSAPDVRTARYIMEAEGLPLKVINHLAYPLVAPGEFQPVLQSLFHFFDGLTTQGMVDSGQELETRLSRSANVLLQMNGGGGEAFRNFWRLPARPTSVRAFVAHLLLGHVDYSVCSPVFDRHMLIDSMESKIRETLGIDANRPLPDCIGTLYARLYQHYWVGRNMSNNATLSHALAPLAEPEFIAIADAIPHRSRLLGQFEATVIRIISPRLAAYPSSYGFSFDSPPNFLRRLAESAMVAFPPSLRRPFLALHGRFASLARMPPFLHETYIEGAFGKGRLEIERYLDVRKIHHIESRNRALSMEFLLREVT